MKKHQLQKFMKMLSLTSLNYLILPNWVIILLVFIDFCKYLYFCNFLTPLVNMALTVFLYIYKPVIALLPYSFVYKSHNIVLFSKPFIHAYELMLGLHVFCQTGPP